MADIEVFSLADVVVPHEATSPERGAPTAGSTAVTTLGEAEVGVWEMSVGTARDVEADEVFVLLQGRATIEAEGAEPIEIKAGDLVRLTAGTKTVWRVTEPLRKVYVVA